VRMNTRLAEAPSHRKSIFEYAPTSHGAADYNRVVDWLLASNTVGADATPGLVFQVQPTAAAATL